MTAVAVWFTPEAELDARRIVLTVSNERAVPFPSTQPAKALGDDGPAGRPEGAGTPADGAPLGAAMDGIPLGAETLGADGKPLGAEAEGAPLGAERGPDGMADGPS